jgi:cardiolipin synthase
VLVCAIAHGCGPGDPISPRFALEHTHSVRDPQFRRAMEGLFRSPVVGGNSLTMLVDARETYPAMLDAIRTAKGSITFETYTFWSGKVGDQFVAALSEQAESGVDTLMIYDDVGSGRIKSDDVKAITEAGADVIRYNPIEKILLVFMAPKVNHRTHRKLLVVDGRVGFIGGVGIADLWLGDDDDRTAPWRDTMYRLEGPIVAHLQSAFMDHWTPLAKDLRHGDAFFPALERIGDVDCQVVIGAPKDGEADIELMYLLAIAAAEQSIDIGTPYFVPDDLLIEALCAARTRGVKVRIVVPGPHIDQEMVRDASRARWDELLQAGVEIYEYQPAMCHYKIMVIDGFWSSIGSANLDPRSLRLSHEANLNVYDSGFAAEQIQLLERDIGQSKRITEAKHERRSLLDRVQEFFASLFSPQL